jgi:hypothetical protein
MPGGKAGWSTFPAQRDGSVQIHTPAEVWNKLVQGLNSMEVTEHQGWAVANVRVNAKSGERLAVKLDCKVGSPPSW